MRIKNLSKRWLSTHQACSSAIKVFEEQKEKDVIKILEALLSRCYEIVPDAQYLFYGNWAEWLLVRVLFTSSREKWAREKIFSSNIFSPKLSQNVRYGLELLKKEIK